MRDAVLITGLNGSVSSVIAARARSRGLLVVGTTRSHTDPAVEVDHWLPGFDLTVPGRGEALADVVCAVTEGRVHVVHGAGYFPAFATVEQSDPAALVAAVQSNLTTLLLLAHGVCPLMVERGGGVLAAFSCHAVDRRYPRMVAFAAAKKGVEVTMAGLASELAGEGVIPLTFAPATIDTKIERQRVPYGDYGNWMRPEEVADVVLDHLAQGSEDLRQGRALQAGNVIHLFRHSDRYFVDGFLTRIGAVPETHG